MIRLNTVNKIIGTLLFLEATMMGLCMGMSLYLGEEDSLAFVMAVIVTVLGGVFFKYLGRNSDNTLGRREAFLLVTLTWLIFSLFGSLPFLISGHIRHFTDAYFETISGFTTTGCSILTDVERLPHALLFAGPDGVGKLRVARALAAAILCENAGERPCGHCPQCRALQQDTHPDYYELHPEGKAIKTIKIDAIRQVQTEAARLPLLAKKRVIVIDDAEAMNEAAENSLLKTLEEPTGAVHFILVTRAKSSLLDTILSRCMHVGFGSIPEAELARALVQRGIPEGAATELAALSDGSFGRALALYENDGLKLRDDAAKFLRERAQLTVQDSLITEHGDLVCVLLFRSIPKQMILLFLWKIFREALVPIGIRSSVTKNS